jgi:NTE family protein
MDQPNSLMRIGRTAKTGAKTVNLALQGGGSPGAFTWGVLDRLLEEKALAFEGITGTSAGAVNAVVLADGRAAGGPQGAREALSAYWRKVSGLSSQSLMAPTPLNKAMDFPLVHPLSFVFLTYFASPYQTNPFNYNPFRELLKESVNFERVREQTAVKLFLCATNVQTAKIQIFHGRDTRLEHLLASTCLPLLMHAVEVDGEYYWDGSYAAILRSFHWFTTAPPATS